MALPMKKVAMKKAAAMKKAGAMKKARVMKKAGAMKKASAMKRVMKAKKASKIAKGARALSRVFSGSKEKTSGGLTKADLTKSKSGKVVSKKKSAQGKKNYAKNGLKKWADALKAARKAVGLTGFVPMGGKTAAGKALYAKAKSLL
jgi:hypothetical protein